jgi:RecB family exonuclease
VRELGHGVFGLFAEEPAFARSALEVLFALKAGGLNPSGFAAAVERLPSARALSGRYLAQLYRAYEDKMASLRLADREDRLRGATERLRNGLPDPLPNAAKIEIAQIHDFPPLRLEFLIALAQACDRSQIEFCLDLPAAGSPHLDAVVDPVLAEFERRGQELRRVESRKHDFLAEGLPFAGIGRSLFSPEAATLDHQALRPRLSLLTAKTGRAEAKQLAHCALRFIEQGTPPERIAIAYRELGREAEWIAEALEELGVSARIRRGAPLASAASAKIALDWPMLVEDGFPAERVARLLSSRYLRPLSVGAPECPERVLAMAGVRDDALGAESGRGAYQVRLGAFAGRMRQRNREALATQATHLLDRCQRLIELGRRIPPQGRAVDLLQRWWSCLEDLEWKRAVRGRENRAEEGTALGRAVLRALARDQAACEALESMVIELETALQLAGASSDQLGRRTFHRLLLDAASDFNLMPTSTRGGAVHVLDVRELCGLRFSRVLIGGVSDGRFPGPAAPNPLFSDDDRVAVNQSAGRPVFRVTSGEPESSISWRAGEDRLLFYLALCAAQDGVVLSYAREGARGEEQLPSPFFNEIQRLTGCEPENLFVQPVPALRDVQTEAELRERVAIEVLARPEIRTFPPDPDRGALFARFRNEPWFSQASRLVAVEEERLHFFSRPEASVGSFTGAIGSGELLDRLALRFRFGADRPASSSLLRRFGNCAFQGFLTDVVGLEEPDLPGEELDARREGSFWHEILERLFVRLKEARLLGRPWEQIPSEIADQALQEAARTAEQGEHVGHPLLWKLRQERARAMVRRLLRTDHRGLPFEAQLPIRTELQFGRAQSPEGWREVRLPALDGSEEIFLEGKIDRLDSGTGSIGVIDYKSGSIPGGRSLTDSLLVTEFQLPVYLYAVRSSNEAAGVRGAWISLKSGKASYLEEALADHGNQTLDELISANPEVRRRVEERGGKNLVSAVHRLANQIRAGQFAIRPVDCGFCTFKPVCRITERRLDEAPA